MIKEKVSFLFFDLDMWIRLLILVGKKCIVVGNWMSLWYICLFRFFIYGMYNLLYEFRIERISIFDILILKLLINIFYLKL